MVDNSARADSLKHTWGMQLSEAALERTKYFVFFHPAYMEIDYPGGDIPSVFGTGADLIVRAYRVLGIDLQQEIHEDISAHFDSYPTPRHQLKPDTNIDHRRIANLRVLFERHGTQLPTTHQAEDFAPGDLVIWTLENQRTHIGIVTDQFSSDGKRPLIVHNKGRGPIAEDALYRYPISGHYRYYGKPYQLAQQTLSQP